MPPTNAPAREAEELQLKQAIAALLRRWPYVLATMALGGIAAGSSALRTRPSWEGSFEIVLESKSPSVGGALSSNPLLASLAGLDGPGGKQGQLKTDVKILQTALVLQPVFDEVRRQKASLGEDVGGYRFNSWARNLRLEVEKDTSVLMVSYRDTTKSLILPVLRSISDAYQNYSVRERNESLKKAINYAEKQAQIYRERSDASFRALNSFGLTYGISSAIKGGGSGGGVDISKLLSPSNSSGLALNFGGGSGSSTNLNSSNPLGQLAKLNQQLIRQQQTFTANDPTVIALKKERDAVRRYIESSAFGNIAYPGKQTISKEQAQNILIRHQELERKANRDQTTLDSMENALISLQLEQARASTPWQLITTPTVLEQPVAPRTTRSLAIGLASGLLIGCIAALIADQRSGRLFDKDRFKELLPAQLLLELPSDQSHTWNDGLRLLGLGNAQGGSIAILPLGDVQRSHTNIVRDILKQTCTTNIEICLSTLEATKFDKLLLLAAPGSIEESHLDRLVQELGLQRTPIIGWIWLD